MRGGHSAQGAPRGPRGGPPSPARCGLLVQEGGAPGRTEGEAWFTPRSERFGAGAQGPGDGSGGTSEPPSLLAHTASFLGSRRIPGWREWARLSGPREDGVTDTCHRATAQG